MNKLAMMALVALVSGCVGGGGGGGGGDGLPWVDCTEEPGEAPCCPRIDVEALCVDGESLQDDTSESGYRGCLAGDQYPVIVSFMEGYVWRVRMAFGRLSWSGEAICGEDGRIEVFEARDESGAGCVAVCNVDACMTATQCPELNPFPLEQALHAAPGDGQPIDPPNDSGV